MALEDCAEFDGDFDNVGIADRRKAEIAKQVSEIDFRPLGTDIEVDLSRATRLPLEELTSLGVGFASLPEAFRTVKVGADGLYWATDAAGNSLASGALCRFKDNSAFLGSFSDVEKGFGQARLHPAMPGDGAIVATVPYDPSTLFMAAALMEINKKLDAIQETQQEMFEYIRQKDKAESRGNLETLSDVLNNYRFNWDNQLYKSNKHALVQTIRSDAEKAIIHQRAQIEGKLVKGGPIHVDKNVRDKIDAVKDELQEYRLSVYLYAFASFLEVMLLENYDSEYLVATIERIERYSLRYRELYTEAYDLIEQEADTSVRAVALGGISSVFSAVGKAIENTPIGDATLIDEALKGAGEKVGELNAEIREDMTLKLVEASSSDVRPFIDNIQNVDRLYNTPETLLVDDEAIYILPADAE